MASRLNLHWLQALHAPHVTVIPSCRRHSCALQKVVSPAQAQKETGVRRLPSAAWRIADACVHSLCGRAAPPPRAVPATDHSPGASGMENGRRPRRGRAPCPGCILGRQTRTAGAHATATLCGGERRGAPSVRAVQFVPSTRLVSSSFRSRDRVPEGGSQEKKFCQGPHHNGLLTHPLYPTAGTGTRFHHDTPDFSLTSGSPGDKASTRSRGPATRVTCQGNQDSLRLSLHGQSPAGPNETGRKAHSPKTKVPARAPRSKFRVALVPV